MASSAITADAVFNASAVAASMQHPPCRGLPFLVRNSCVMRAGLCQLRLRAGLLMLMMLCPRVAGCCFLCRVIKGLRISKVTLRCCRF